MKITVYLHSLAGGGAEKIMLEFLNYLSAHTNHDLTLILTLNKGQYNELLNPRIKLVCLNKKGAIDSVYPLFNYLKKERPDVLYSSLTNPNLISIVVGKLLGVRVIIRKANTILEFSKAKKSKLVELSSYASKYLYKYAFRCIAISNIVKDDLLKYTKLSEGQISVIYNPLFIIDTISNDDIYLDPDYFHIGFASRLSQQKNIITIVKVIEAFINTKYKVIFHFFGEGSDKYLLDEIAEKYKDNLIVQLHGFNLSYYSYIKHMNLFIHIPLWEGFGNSVLEVFNSGIPMILSNAATGYSELISPELPNIHYVHPVNDESIIVDLIKSYIECKIPVSSQRNKIVISADAVFDKYLAIADL